MMSKCGIRMVDKSGMITRCILPTPDCSHYGRGSKEPLSGQAGVDAGIAEFVGYETTLESDGFPIEVRFETGHPTVVGLNEGGYNSVDFDLLQLIEWIRDNQKELAATIRKLLDNSVP